MKINRLLHNIAVRTACLIAGVATLASCNGMMYDGEGDCDPYHKVKFVFDKNLSFTDAFDKEVNAVTLYVIDAATGNIVWSKSESGDNVRSSGYLMDVDVPPGDYRLLAWCGEGKDTHFTVPDAAHFTGLTCALNRGRDEAGAVSKEALNRLYHGHVENETFVDEEGVHIHTVELVKDTNHVNVVLQNLSGKPIDKDNFTFRITDCNGSMDWDNSLLDDELITYHPHNVASGSAGIVTPDPTDPKPTDPKTVSRSITQVNTCVAQFTTGRLVKGQDMRVIITNSKGREVLNIPLIDYSLLVKGHYESLDDQDFLDRQDKYDLVFFLDDRDEWVSTYIYVNAWHKVPQIVDL